jgi:NDP-sugar pyrophosphorylase family protein
MPHSGLRRAIVLAAGMGNRLRPMTDLVPKPLLPVNGIAILENCLLVLDRAGLTEVTIVTGYRSASITGTFDRRFAGLALDYVVTDRFETTNNICSLWAARDHLDQDCLLIEGDVFFEDEVISRLIDCEAANVLAVDELGAKVSGAVAQVDATSRVVDLQIAQPGDRLAADRFKKTLSVHKLSAPFLQEALLPEIRGTIGRGGVQEFYELALGRVIRRGLAEVHAVSCNTARWIEIDDPVDYGTAQLMFGRRPTACPAADCAPRGLAK